MEFNQEQQNIINQLKGAFLINAPVGTGKTTVLTARVVSAIKNGFKPDEILCLTFTNRAAEEMKSRLKAELPRKEDFNELTISTFHAFCAMLLKSEAKELGLAPDFTIFDEDEQLTLLMAIIEPYAEKLYLTNNSSKNELNNLSENLYQYRLKQLEAKLGVDQAPTTDTLKEDILLAYEKALVEQNALDFNRLVLFTLEALYLNEAVRAKWLGRFKFIQLDEFQDTHLSEYLVVKELAKTSKNLSLIGDLDQTIYTWRGSKPRFIAEVFKKHFAPVVELELSLNYRSDPALLAKFKNVLKNLDNPVTKNLSSGLPLGADECLEIFSGHNFNEEIDWVLSKIKEVKAKQPTARLAVLARKNSQINQAAEIFKQKKVSHLTVDHYNFFRRQEVKDALAYIKILFNRFDLDSAYRLSARPPKELGEATLASIRHQGQDVALKISDFLYLPNFSHAEPFADLLKNYEQGRVVVLDTETTGLNPNYDEVVQIYAQEVVNGVKGKDFHFYLKNSLPVGSSAEVHHLTDEFLATNGRQPKEVFSELKDFIASSAVIGHNVSFDLAMLKSHGTREQVEFEFKNFYDTLDLAKRLINSDNYRLSTLAKLFSLAGATHSADDDVDATVALLDILIGKLKLGAGERQKLFAKYGKKFIRLATQLTNWQYLIIKERPAHALEKIIEESGLKDYYARQAEGAKRLASLESLIKLFGQKDDLNKSPIDSLRQIVTASVLVKNIDLLALDGGGTPILTIHQVKGLEFDYVFIVGLNEGQFPLYNCTDMAEETRLFYVALTRAKKGLYLSHSLFNQNGYNQAPSRFLGYLE